ncbi:MAG: hypothetical protein K0S88_6122 [Actinomycetia bacterium]|jgi:hypothetical protein|nr:hypothetical protein [Actinomycetes bacterium]
MNRIRLATAGLLVAWMAHDLEELATMSDSSRTLMRQLPDWMPAPASIRQGFTARYLATSIPAIGMVVAAATIRGYRTQSAQPSTRTHCSALACTGSAPSP